MRIDEIGEFGLIDRLKTLIGASGKGVAVGISDDAAAIRPESGKLVLLTTDALVEHVHFDFSYFTPYQLGWRAMTANLSDIAAMAGQPAYALVTIAIPERYTVETVEALYKGMLAVAARFDTQIIGGDSTRSPHSLFVSLTLIGHVDEDRLKRRCAAQIAEGIFVTGDLGASHAGMLCLQAGHTEAIEALPHIVAKHLTPLPRVRESLHLSEQFQISALIDITDGLAPEIDHICRLSAVGARISADRIPIHRQTRQMAARLNDDAAGYALRGGEDYELLFTAPLALQEELQRTLLQEFQCDCACIGEIVAASEGISLVNEGGELLPLPAPGFDHFSKPVRK